MKAVTGVKEIRVKDPAGAFRAIYFATPPRGRLRAALFSEENAADGAARYRTRSATIERYNEVRFMAKKKVRSVFHDLYPEDQAAEMEMRSLLLRGLGSWLEASSMTQTEVGKYLGVTQARISDIKRGKISRFSLDLLVRLAARAGLQPKLKLAA
jgi:predicted XRE-type DNA-binding protein